MSNTSRGKDGFGTIHPTLKATLPSEYDTLLESTENPTINQTITPLIDEDDIHLPTCNIELSPDPFFDAEVITLDVRGKHKTQGLMLEESNDWDDRVIITGCHPGTAGRRIKNWTTRIKNALLLAINSTPITTKEQAHHLIADIMKQKHTTFSITVSPDERSAMHHEEGVPMLYFDQLATIASHLHGIQYNLVNAKTTST